MTQPSAAYDVGVIHGRFQVLHNDHLKYLLAGKERCRHLVVGITNAEPDMIQPEAADPERSKPEANPLSYYERYQLVRCALVEAGVSLADFSIVPFPISQPERYRHYVPLDAVFFLSIYDDWGRRKKQRFESLGLKICVLREVTRAEKGQSATQVRQCMINGTPWRHLVPASVAALLETWRIAQRLSELAGATPNAGAQKMASTAR
jgi:nicotinamide-nucleotide adenylyltransferase